MQKPWRLLHTKNFATPHIFYPSTAEFAMSHFFTKIQSSLAMLLLRFITIEASDFSNMTFDLEESDLELPPLHVNENYEEMPIHRFFMEYQPDYCLQAVEVTGQCESSAFAPAM